MSEGGGRKSPGRNGIISFKMAGYTTGALCWQPKYNDMHNSKGGIMTKPLFACLKAVSKNDDLKPNPELNINPPPNNEPCCHGCGRPISQLKPFGVNVPGFGDLTNAKLVRTYRCDTYRPPQDVVEAIETSLEGYPNSDCISYEDWYSGLLARIVEKLGCTEEEADNYVGWEQLSNYVGPSIECRDCFYLSTKRFHLTRRNIYYGEHE
jgi:hypothetical protein